MIAPTGNLQGLSRNLHYRLKVQRVLFCDSVLFPMIADDVQGLVLTLERGVFKAQSLVFLVALLFNKKPIFFGNQFTEKTT